jgi:hypothetical protein
MQENLEKLVKKVKRRRLRFYVFAIIIIAGLVASGIVGYVIYGATEQGMMGFESSLFLSFAVLLLLLIPVKDMRRIEQIVVLASQHGGSLQLETIHQEMGLPEKKAISLLGWLEHQKIAEKREKTGRWVFPELRRSSEKS